MTNINNFDSWNNLFTGLNTSKDKRSAAFAVHRLLGQVEAETIYSSDEMARKIVDKLPGEAVREWISFEGDKKLEDNFISEYKRLKIQEQLKLASITSRIYGGAVLLLVTDDVDVNNLWKPISKAKNIINTKIFNRYEVSYSVLDQDITSTNFGMPLIYTITPRSGGLSGQGMIRVHWSRVIRFEGKHLPQNLFIKNSYWHDSVLASIQEELKSYSQVHGSIAGILLDFRMRIMKISNLANMMADDCQTDVLVKRVQLLNLCVSTLNTALIDMDESLEQNTPTLTNIDKLVQKVENRLVAASGLPHTILLGDSPSGLGATGNSEKNDFDNTIKEFQTQYLAPKIDYINSILSMCSKGPTSGKPLPPEFTYEWNPLQQPTSKEKSETRKLMSEADKNYYEMNVLSSEEIRSNRFGGQKYSVDTTVEGEIDSDNGDLEKDIKELENKSQENK